jgi:23S rRNA (cytidine2498-2'-O)-methyltransferase
VSIAMQLYYCRAGFEADCAAELEDAARDAGIEGRCDFSAKQAYVLWRPGGKRANSRTRFPPALDDLVFARQKVDRVRLVGEVRAPDRVRPIIEAARQFGMRFGALWLEAPDSETGNKLLAQARHLTEPLEIALRAADLHGTGRYAPRLHVCFIESDSALIGLSDPRESSPWPMGIPRLRAPAAAPSRSAMKLLEALHTFIPEARILSRMRAGRVAVDLGAAPGGWSQVLASRGLRVIAVDNGAMAAEVIATQLVEQRGDDAFRFRPQHPVDWMVCDVVAAPARIAALAAQWIARGWCRETIFNLKLPHRSGVRRQAREPGSDPEGRSRWNEVRRCADVIERALSQVGGRHELRIKHLYHDREEVTAHLRRL